MSKFKLSFKRRQQQAATKLRNWDKIVVQQREYMRKYRAKEPGKTIVRKAQAAYVKRNKMAFLLYASLRGQMQKDGLYGRKPSKSTRVVGNWKIKRG